MTRFYFLLSIIIGSNDIFLQLARKTHAKFVLLVYIPTNYCIAGMNVIYNLPFFMKTSCLCSLSSSPQRALFQRQKFVYNRGHWSVILITLRAVLMICEPQKASPRHIFRMKMEPTMMYKIFSVRSIRFTKNSLKQFRRWTSERGQTK